MATEKTPAQRVAEMTPEKRKKVKRVYRIAAAIEALLLVISILLACTFYKKAHDSKLLAENWKVGSPYSVVEMHDREDAMMKNVVRTMFGGGAAMLVGFCAWLATSPDNRESIYREIRRLDKAEQAKN